LNIREAALSVITSKRMGVSLTVRKESDQTFSVRFVAENLAIIVPDEIGDRNLPYIVTYLSDQRLAGDDWYTVKQGGGD